MKKEDRLLLLKSLCAYLPYGLKCDKDGEVYDLVSVEIPQGFVRIKKMVNHLPVITTRSILREDVVKPYLRPLSSMADEEIKELDDIEPSAIVYGFSPEIIRIVDDTNSLGIKLAQTVRVIDWLNAHHFDFQGLIEKGLALKAPKEMYD